VLLVKGINMPKRARGAEKKRSAKRRAIDRYGAEAVKKYYQPARLVRAPGETGYVDLASASYGCDTTGTITLLATIPQGASVSQRIGKKIMLKSLQFRGNLQNNASAEFNDAAFLVVYDNRPTGALPAVTDVLVTANSRSFNNDTNSGRFKILKRVDEGLAGNGTGPTESTIKSCDFFLKINRKCEFAAAGTGAIGDSRLGALYLITVGTNVNGATAATLVGGFRTRYIDV